MGDGPGSSEPHARCVAPGRGLAGGLLAALLGSRVLSRSLYGVSAHDPLAIGAAAFVMLSSAMLAVIGPARRASRADPVSILRRL